MGKFGGSIWGESPKKKPTIKKKVAKKMTIIETMINNFRQWQNYILESRNEEAKYTEEERYRFERLAEAYKVKGDKVLNYLIKEIGIEKEYLEELLKNEGI